MNAIGFVVSFALFLGGIFLMGIAFDQIEQGLPLFAGGILAITVGVFIPIHILQKSDDL